LGITSEMCESVFLLYVVVDMCDVVTVKHVVILSRFVGGTPLKLGFSSGLFTTEITLKLLY